MNYRYIALVDDVNLRNQNKTHDIQETLVHDMDMEKCWSAGPIHVFVAKQTPRLLIPGHGVIIGHLFSRDGQRVTTAARLAPYSSYQALEKHLLEHYWGEYLLIHFSEKQDSALTVLRTPSGGMPCLYSLRTGVGFITSNISIATHLQLFKKAIDWDYIAQELTFSHLRTPRTGLSTISELLPGTALTLRNTHVTTQTSWSPWDFVAAGHRHSNMIEAAAELRKSVSTVVKSLAETDGVIMLTLSGGLDSSIVAAALGRVKAQVHCMNLVMPEPGTDERRYAKQMTDHLGTELQVLHVTAAHTPMDFPVGPDAVVPSIGPLQDDKGRKVFETLADAYGLTSFFSGNGGDTVFCYLGNASPAADAFKERGFAAGIAAIRNLSVLHQCTLGKAGRLTLRKLLRGPRAPWKTDCSFLNTANVPHTLPHHPWFELQRKALPGDREKIYTLIATQSFRVFPFRGGSRLDRVPLLSQPVMEACLKIPTWMWITEGKNRFVARTAFADLLPQGILNRQDKGSYINHKMAYYQKHKFQVRELLLTGHLQAQKLLDVEAIARFFEKDLSSADHASRVFELCRIENWLRHQIS